MTKICIFGAGAIGGYIAASLAKTNAEISLIARGPHKKAIEENIYSSDMTNGDFKEEEKFFSFENSESKVREIIKNNVNK